jgi:uncharacterized protein DUF6714
MPKPNRIVQPNLLAEPNLASLLKDFAGKRWADLDAETVERQYDALSFLTPEAFRYYLPAYMLGCLAWLRTAKNIDNSVVFHLDPPKSEDERPAFLEIASGFSSPQRAAIRLFLEYMRARGDVLGQIAHALKTYWAASVSN